MISRWASLFTALALTAANNASGSTPTEQTVGVPVTLGQGITRTVDQIMAGDQLQQTVTPMLPDRPHPGIDAMVPGPPDLPQTVGTSFKAVAYSESGFIPPDIGGDVGPTQVLVHVNGRIKVFSKAGVLGALNVSGSSFWAPVAGEAYSPQVRYDRISGRWFVIAITPESQNNKILIAVSSGPTITSAASFTFYSFAVGIPSPGDLFYYCDAASLGIDAQALYLGCNMFNNPFFHSSGFVVRKSSVLGGGPLVVTGFEGIDYEGTYAPQGVDNDDPNWAEGYFIGPDFFQINMLNMWRVSDPGGVPSLGSRIHISTSNTHILDQSASGSIIPLHAFDLRLFAASIHKNKLTGVTSLWTAHSIETDTACTPAESGSSRRLGAKWYEIGDLTGTPTITQTGTLCTTTLGSATSNTQRGFLYPTVTETGQGHMALAASFASSTDFAGVAAAGRVRTDPVGGTRAPETVVIAGLGNYQVLDGQNRNRWGSYSFTSVDPNDDQTVWTFQEYADTGNTWSVRAVQLKAPPPPNLQSVSNSVCIGAAAIPVTLGGADACAAPTCTNGLCTAGGACPEFFDPGPDTGGPGYANHISATVSGGVTVNSTNLVMPADPSTQRVLSVTLSLNTTAATAGTKVVTITNPDGQSKSLGILTVMSNRLPSSNAGGPYASCETGSVVLDGTASTDPDAACGDSLTLYSWDLNNDGTFDVTGPTPTVTAAQLNALGIGVGVHTIALRVTDTHAGTNTSNGTLTILAQGAACTDGNACTQIDICQSGTCVGANPVACAPSDQCHDAGVCNPATGVCSNPNKVDGAVCNDANACTQTDACQAGTCVGSNPVVCSANDQCHAIGTCDSGTGICSNPPRPDGTICNDGDVGTCGDVCTSAICAGHAVAKPDGINDSLMFAMSGSDPYLFWTDAPGPYGIYRGVKAPGPWTYNQSCVGRITGSSAYAFGNPPTGSFFYYFVSRYNECRESELGTDSESHPIPNAAPCPAPP